jgi:hypothetical protein
VIQENLSQTLGTALFLIPTYFSADFEAKGCMMKNFWEKLTCVCGINYMNEHKMDGFF